MAAGEGPARIEDVAGVRSRISWSAVLAGAVIAVAANMVFTMFFSAIGLTLTETDVRANAIGVGALIAVLLGMLAALFLGGWVAAQLTAGETEREAVLYGILTWAAAVGISVLMVGASVRAGYFALVGGAVVAQQTPEAQNAQNWEQALRNAGATQAQIDSVRNGLDPNRARATAEDPAAQERARQAAIGASWAALVGVLLSMATAIGGALVGRGPAFRLLPVARAQVTETRQALIIP
ncbi:MAG: hypothetical protein J0I06_27095 [Planctomycetes bacterium]|nr:hypothetical protein [Planctomycetota bacterium]